ncbi:hypothetical protein MLD38_010783 [Melastoma candidum]|uniref:Uncharacterized protein n=1 Tax=Melastoma candidum TaxID=119954 RepID=A0ACB9R0Y9_9MYRT|nr:hypothetical protein MLD38_010783 [Melastoma candidum]
MITDAIAAMKDRNGSSHAAIRKFVEQKHGDRLPPNFRKRLIAQLKRLVGSGELVEVKRPFKVPGGARPSPGSSVSAKGRRRSAKNPKAGKAGAAGRTARSAKTSK